VLHALFSVRARSLVASKMGNRFRRGGPEQLAARDWVSRTCLEQLAAQDRCRMPVWSSWLLRIGVACLFGAAGCSGSVSYTCLEQLAAQDRCRIPVWCSWLLRIGGSGALRSSWLLRIGIAHLFGAAGCSGPGGQGRRRAAGCSKWLRATSLEQLAARDRYRESVWSSWQLETSGIQERRVAAAVRRTCGQRPEWAAFCISAR